MCSSTCIPCTAFRMSARITCWYLVLVPLCTVLRLVSQARANVPIIVFPTPRAVCLGITGAEHTRPCWCLFRTGQMCLVCPTLCAVRLGITGAERTRPCWCLFRTGQMRLVCPTLCAVRLGITGAERTRPCWCLFRTGSMCLVCPTLCAVRLGITGAEPTRPCWCFVLVSLSYSASLDLYSA